MRAATTVLLTILTALPMTARSQRGAPEDVLVRASAGFPMSVTVAQVEASCARRRMEVRSGTSAGFEVRICERTEHGRRMIHRYELVRRDPEQLVLSKFVLAEAGATLEEAIARLTTLYRALQARYGAYQQVTGGDCVPNAPTDIAGCVAAEGAAQAGHRGYTYAWMFEPPYHPTLALELDHIHTIRLTLTESEGGWDVVASWQSSRASERTPRQP